MSLKSLNQEMQEMDYPDIRGYHLQEEQMYTYGHRCWSD